MTLCDLNDLWGHTCWNENLPLHNVSIHTHFHQNQFIDKCTRKKSKIFVNLRCKRIYFLLKRVIILTKKFMSCVKQSSTYGLLSLFVPCFFIQNKLYSSELNRNGFNYCRWKYFWCTMLYCLSLQIRSCH